MPKPYSEFTNEELIALRNEQVKAHNSNYHTVSDDLAAKNDGIDPLFEVEAMLNVADNINHAIQAGAADHLGEEETAELEAEAKEVFERVVDALNHINQTGSYRTTAFIRGYVQAAYQGVKQFNDNRLGVEDDDDSANLPSEISSFLDSLKGRYDKED